MAKRSLLSKCPSYIKMYVIIIFPTALYWYKSWTIKYTDAHTVTVFKNSVLRKIFGSKKEEVTGDWRILRNWEFHVLYPSPNLTRSI
jgi:hypothetical protein